MSVALVTGAAGIVGPGICAELRAAGWTVAASDLSAETFALYERGHDAPVAADAMIAADLAEPGSAGRLVEEVRRRLGPVALLVNNATGHNRAVPFPELDEQVCGRIWKVDVLAPLLLAQAAAAGESALESVVNISSVRLEHITPGHLPYIVAKAAVEKMTAVLAVELADRRIRVNCLRLGSVPGDAYLQGALDLVPPEHRSQLRAEVSSDHRAAMGAAFTLGAEAGSPAEIGRAVAFLASPAARFINGAVIPIDGGYALKQHQRAAAAPVAPSPGQQWKDDPRGKLKAWLESRGMAHEL